MDIARVMRRVAAVLILVTAVSTLGVGVGLPVSRYLSDRETLIVQREMHVIGLARQVAGIGPLREQLEQAKRLRSTHSALMRAPSVPLAAAALRERLKLGVEAVGGGA